MKSQIKFLRLTFYGQLATPCQESTPSHSILLVFSLWDVLRFGLWAPEKVYKFGLCVHYHMYESRLYVRGMGFIEAESEKVSELS
jgi:hypothetical protein